MLWYILLTIALSVLAAKAGRVCTDTVTTKPSQADYLFLIDASGSMCSKIAGVKSGLLGFSQQIQASQIIARFGVVQFGGTPVILMPFNNNATLLAQVIGGIQCYAGGQEAAFEVLRGSVPPENGRLFGRGCSADVGGADPSNCNINWNLNATKALILVTDEDSDLPNIGAYRMPGQDASASFCYLQRDSAGNCQWAGYQFEPSFTSSSLMQVTNSGTYSWQMVRDAPFLQLSPSFEAELELTAQIMNREGIFLNSLVALTVGANNAYWGYDLPISAFNAASSQQYAAKMMNQTPDDMTVATYQFGHPSYQSQASNYSLFDASKTIDMLAAGGFGNSLQSRMLSSGGYSRVFDIAAFNTYSQSAIINAFYRTIVETTSYLERNCVFYPDTTSAVVIATTQQTENIPTGVPAITTTLTLSSTLLTSTIAKSTLQIATTSTLLASVIPTTTLTKQSTSSILLTSMARALTSTVPTSSVVVSTPSAQMSFSLISASTVSSDDRITETLTSSSKVIASHVPTMSKPSVATDDCITETFSSSPTVTGTPVPPDEIIQEPIGGPKVGPPVIPIFAGVCCACVAAAAGAVLYRRRRHQNYLSSFRSNQVTASGELINNPLYGSNAGFVQNGIFENAYSMDSLQSAGI